MPVRCSFGLNGQETSVLSCEGFGPVQTFSGHGVGRDNPHDTAMEDVGPLPAGTYYLVNRQSGGRVGWLRDWLGAHGYVSTDHTKWFMLWNEHGGDTTFIQGVKRGRFRLHPVGRRGLSEGCIAVVDPSEFDRLQRFIRTKSPTLWVPGSTMKAYGTVEVR